MFNNHLNISPVLKIIYLLALLGFAGCGQVSSYQVNPYTGRSQKIYISESKEIELAQYAWKKIFDDPQVLLSQEPKQLMPFQRVFEKLVDSAKKSKFSERAKKFNWELRVIKDETKMNGYSLPGGKIAFYTGLLSLARKDEGIALAMGNLIAKSLARHQSEAMSNKIMSQIDSIGSVGYPLGDITATPNEEQLREADYMGLLLAARAGYDPRKLMKAKTLGLISVDRINILKTHVDEALNLYKSIYQN